MESQQDRTARIVQAHREYYQSGQTRIWQFRRTQLRLLLKAIGRYEAELCEALWRDLHKGGGVPDRNRSCKGGNERIDPAPETLECDQACGNAAVYVRFVQPYPAGTIRSGRDPFPVELSVSIVVCTACRRIGCRKLRGTETLAPYACGKRSDAQADFGSFCPGIRVVFGRRCRDGPCVTAATVGLYLFYR